MRVFVRCARAQLIRVSTRACCTIYPDHQLDSSDRSTKFGISVTEVLHRTTAAATSPVAGSIPVRPGAIVIALGESPPVLLLLHWARAPQHRLFQPLEVADGAPGQHGVQRPVVLVARRAEPVRLPRRGAGEAGSSHQRRGCLCVCLCVFLPPSTPAPTSQLSSALSWWGGAPTRRR
jgi:hypothetical protein